MITFYLNGQPHEISQLNPNTTVLEYLRLHARQMDTKEGCGSGDCGACTVMAQRLPASAETPTNSAPFYTLNACITLLSLMDNHHIMTAAYLADNPENHPERALLHPAQQAMVDCHGSQCGFCTPGFIMSLASVYENKRMQTGQDANADNLSYDEIVASIAGNLCRCTGYRPIIEAGLAMQKIAQKRAEDQVSAKDLVVTLATDAMATSKRNDASANTHGNKQTIAPALIEGARQLFIPQSTDELDQLLAVYPKATIWAGGTDLGLSVTQNLVDHDVIIQLAAIESLKSWSVVDDDSQSDNSSVQAATQEATQTLIFGAGMSYKAMLPALEQYFPEFADLFERIASPQIRNMGTIGGNVANASPIGDLPPILLALDARIHIRHCDVNNDEVDNSAQPFVDETLPLSEFFLDYKKTKLRAGSYVVAIHIPLMQDNQHLFIHKISKRFEDDISACLVAVRLDLSADSTTIDDVKIGLGGMAAVPLLVENCQQALVGQPFTIASFEQAAKALPLDVSPMTDVRASREYRLHVVQRLLIKCGKQLIKGAQTEGA
ncbi:MAG: FAD binding domain-containing protein [Psychrobacter sp.]|nr:FAD binding domain-containing protein [Psychrobacter sp.]